MLKRPKSATVDLKVRMKEPLRADLEASAKDRGVSLNAEAVIRLERSFDDERRFGSRDLYRVIDLAASAFALAGQQAAAAIGHLSWKPSTWIYEPQCYHAGVRAALEALINARPDKDDEATDLLVDELEQLLKEITSSRGSADAR